jgi:acetylornithine deacetylase/succinyl-diaminopimelate desuccinylase-like protein
MLEAIRVLHANPSLRNDVLFLFTDGEEVGWRGAMSFIKDHREAKPDSV